MERSNELQGEGMSYTTEFRQYDARLGKWMSLDPLMAMYPHQSPYAAFNDNPIYYADPTGLEGIGPGDKAKERAKRERAQAREDHMFNPDGTKNSADSDYAIEGGVSITDKMPTVTLPPLANDATTPNIQATGNATIPDYVPIKIIPSIGDMYNYGRESFGMDPDPYRAGWMDSYSAVSSFVNLQANNINKGEWYKSAFPPIAIGDRLDDAGNLITNLSEGDLYAWGAVMGSLSQIAIGGAAGSQPKAPASAKTLPITEVAAEMEANLTAHGAERIAGATATRGGVLSIEGINATKSLGRAFTQADGATVYLHEITPGRFNAVIEGNKGIITTMNNWSQKSIIKIARNYGWKLE